jgi:hypothetical protein
MLLPLLALPMQFAGSMLGLGNMFGQNQPNANRDINININNDNHNVNAASSSSHSAHMSHSAARRASHIHY